MSHYEYTEDLKVKDFEGYDLKVKGITTLDLRHSFGTCTGLWVVSLKRLQLSH